MSTNPSRKTLNPIAGQGKSGRGGYNDTKIKTDSTSTPNGDAKCEQVPSPTSLFIGNPISTWLTCFILYNRPTPSLATIYQST